MAKHITCSANFAQSVKKINHPQKDMIMSDLRVLIHVLRTNGDTTPFNVHGLYRRRGLFVAHLLHRKSDILLFFTKTKQSGETAYHLLEVSNHDRADRIKTGGHAMILEDLP